MANHSTAQAGKKLRIKTLHSYSSEKLALLVKRDEKGSKQELEIELAQDRETNTGLRNMC
jgi:hypothetical protein